MDISATIELTSLPERIEINLKTGDKSADGRLTEAIAEIIQALLDSGLTPLCGKIAGQDNCGLAFTQEKQNQQKNEEILEKLIRNLPIKTRVKVFQYFK